MRHEFLGPQGECIFLVQRVSFHPNKRRTGVDSLFRFDYMGSSEFEGGALHHTWKAMKASAQEYILVELQAPLGDNIESVWAVVRPEEQEYAQELFRSELLREKKYRFKESTFISLSFTDPDSSIGCGGWLAVHEKYKKDNYSWKPFAFFEEKAHAKHWMAFQRVEEPSDEVKKLLEAAR